MPPDIKFHRDAQHSFRPCIRLGEAFESHPGMQPAKNQPQPWVWRRIRTYALSLPHFYPIFYIACMESGNIYDRKQDVQTDCFTSACTSCLLILRILPSVPQLLCLSNPRYLASCHFNITVSTFASIPYSEPLTDSSIRSPLSTSNVT